MFVRIDNMPRDYAWGSTTAIAELLGRKASGKPEAELWLGAHPGSASAILDPAQAGGAANLAEWIERDPVSALGIDEPSASAGRPRLPFLLKVLAASGALSLQAHPSSEQAAEGFARENAAGIPLNAPNRNYKDPFHKPEMIVALSERFDALCGFRPVAESAVDVDRLIEAAVKGGLPHEALDRFRSWLAEPADDSAILEKTLSRLLGGADIAEVFVDELVAEAVSAAALFAASAAFDTIGRLAVEYPGDPGIVISILLNRVSLRRGQALYLPAGNIHAYLEGLGIELMAASDNVLRGGLTPKHIDVPELLKVLDFSPLPIPYLTPDEVAPGWELFRPDVPDFELVHIGPAADSGRLALSGPAIALCIDGHTTIADAGESIELTRGDAVFVAPRSGSLDVSTGGEIFVAMAR